MSLRAREAKPTGHAWVSMVRPRHSWQALDDEHLGLSDQVGAASCLCVRMTVPQQGAKSEA